MHRLKSLLASAAVAVAALAAVPAQAVVPLSVVPPGLDPGDTYRLLFLTSSTRDATSADINDYNAFVTAAALTSPELAALATTWTAIASTPAVDARDNTHTNPFTDGVGVPIYNLIGGVLTGNNAGLWSDSGLPFAPCTDVTGSCIVTRAWTGTAPNGEGLNELGTGTTGFGLPYAFGAGWIRWSTELSTASLPFYALSAEITVARLAVPEPAAITLFAVSLAGLGLARRKRRG